MAARVLCVLQAIKEVAELKAALVALSLSLCLSLSLSVSLSFPLSLSFYTPPSEFPCSFCVLTTHHPSSSPTRRGLSRRLEPSRSPLLAGPHRCCVAEKTHVLLRVTTLSDCPLLTV